MDLKSAVHRLLVHTDLVTSRHSAARLPWEAVHRTANALWSSQDVSVELHGRSARINFANPYPFAIRRFPNYNAPQVEIVAASSEALGRKVDVVDIGAAVGDTALLLMDRCSTDIGTLHCVEGDPAFASTLRANLEDDRVIIHEVMLSDSGDEIPELVRSQHQGTASAHGKRSVGSVTLDDLLDSFSADIVKVDTDGYDGTILAGARELLARSCPAVLFEWHPLLCQLVGTNPMLAFDVLRQAGYDRWLFFTKFGQFSHFGDNYLDDLMELCLTSKTLDDWHYDVIALPPQSPIDMVALADLRHWESSAS